MGCERGGARPAYFFFAVLRRVVLRFAVVRFAVARFAVARFAVARFGFALAFARVFVVFFAFAAILLLAFAALRVVGLAALRDFALPAWPALPRFAVRVLLRALLVARALVPLEVFARRVCVAVLATGLDALPVFGAPVF